MQKATSKAKNNAKNRGLSKVRLERQDTIEIEKGIEVLRDAKAQK